MIYLTPRRLPSGQVSMCAFRRAEPKDIFQGIVDLPDLHDAGLTGSKPLEDLHGHPTLSESQWKVSILPHLTIYSMQIPLDIQYTPIL
jgi:hypothetical protein